MSVAEQTPAPTAEHSRVDAAHENGMDTPAPTTADATGGTAMLPTDGALVARGESKKFVLSEVFAWDGDRLAVTSQDALDTLARKRLSPSTSKAMSGCVARWAAERLMPWDSDPFSAAEIGTAGHTVLEDLFSLPAFARTRNQALIILEAHKERAWPGRDAQTNAKRADWHTAVHNAINGLWAIENPTQVVVAALESDFGENATVCDIPFSGFVDRLDWVRDENGVRRQKVVDYKTGKVPSNIGRFGDDHGDQMRLYTEALRVKNGVMPLAASLYYTQHGKSRDVPLSKAAMNKTLAAFRRSWTDLNTYTEQASMPTQSGPLCGWCPLVNACPVAKADGYVDRTGGAPSAADLDLPVRKALPPRPVAAEVEEPRSGYGRAAAAATGAPNPDDDFGSASVGAPVPDDGFNDDFAAEPIPAGYTPPDFGSASTEVAAVGAEESRATTPPGEQFESPAAHVNSEAAAPVATGTEGNTMTATATAAHLSEDKSWFEKSGGVLNANSYAAMAVFGTTSLAYEEINKAGVPLSKVTLDATSKTLLHVVATVHGEFSSNPSLMDGLSTRLRGVLRTVIDANPLPWGGDRAAWDAWVALATKHTRSLALGAIRLYDEGPGDNPWADLAVEAPHVASA